MSTIDSTRPSLWHDSKTDSVRIYYPDGLVEVCFGEYSSDLEFVVSGLSADSGLVALFNLSISLSDFMGYI